MLEIDEQMVNVSRTFLPEWSDCSNIHGSAKSCFEDPRADVVYTDAIAWFIERFGGGKQIAEEDKYDVIIMDAL
jgi:spermidine synthase